jgi:hypothetical protein
MALERIIRPFETGSPFTARKLAPVPVTEPEPPFTVTFGKAEPGDFKPYVNTFRGWEFKETEVERKTSTVRVFQNNDPNSTNWVDVERIDELKVRRNDGERITLELDNPPE